jgi:hypothetical protein
MLLNCILIHKIRYISIIYLLIMKGYYVVSFCAWISVALSNVISERRSAISSHAEY